MEEHLMGISRESMWLGILCLADMLSTVWLVRNGLATEANPILRFYMDRSLTVFVEAKSLLVIGPLIILEWTRRRRPRFVLAMLRMTIALYLGSYCAGIWRINHIIRTGHLVAVSSPVQHGDGRDTS